MRIATWNVNSLKARLERLEGWLARAAPDVLLLQETKLTDADANALKAWFQRFGYELAHHGTGGRMGVAIASKVGLSDVECAFGEPARVVPRASDTEPLSEPRVISAVCGGIRFVNLYAPNGRVIDTPTYAAKLVWYEYLQVWIAKTMRPSEAFVLGGDFNIAPDDRDVWDKTKAHGGTHVSVAEREAFQKLLAWGLFDAYRTQTEIGERYTWWDYRAGDFFKNYGMRIDHLLMTGSLAKRIVLAEIDRESRKGKPTPSDHAPFVVDLDEPGLAFDAGWAGAESRIAERRAAAARSRR
jgi:exodeoxyribonuclease III